MCERVIVGEELGRQMGIVIPSEQLCCKRKERKIVWSS